MENHSRSRKHAENVSRLLQELGDDDDDDDKDIDDGDDDEGRLSGAEADADVAMADDLPDLSQSRYLSLLLFLLICQRDVTHVQLLGQISCMGVFPHIREI